jgi:hypothetical protein
VLAPPVELTEPPVLAPPVELTEPPVLTPPVELTEPPVLTPPVELTEPPVPLPAFALAPPVFPFCRPPEPWGDGSSAELHADSIASIETRVVNLIRAVPLVMGVVLARKFTRTALRGRGTIAGG